MQMTRLHINIKDSEKATIVINLLRELPFVEIEGNVIGNCSPPLIYQSPALYLSIAN